MKRWLLALLFLLLLATQAHAEQIEIGTYLLSIEDFSMSTGAYVLHFLFGMKCDYNCSINDLFLVNGRITDTETIYNEPSEGDFFDKIYRIRAELDDPIDLHKYPFDTQYLPIIFEHKRFPAERLRFVPVKRYSGVDSRVFLPGWDVEGWEAKQSVFKYELDVKNLWSRYIFGINLDRNEVGALFTNFVPILILILVLIFTFMLDIDKLELRIGIVSSILIAAVVFHLAISSKLPPVGYLTFPDKFMILTYLITMATFLLNIAIIREIQTKQKRLAHRIYAVSKVWAPIIIPILYLAIFFFI